MQRHERALIVSWLAGCAALLAVMALWGLAFNGAERAVDAWDDGWVRELERVEATLASGDVATAVLRLEQLDRDCPAVFIKHRRDKERERLLVALGECYVELDKHKKAVATLGRLVAFDPKNFDNHFRLAQTHLHFGDTVAARSAYDQVLAIHPTHQPSVAAVIHMAFAASNYEQVVADYERYLDAWLLAPLQLHFGDHVVEFEARVDGEAHIVEGVVELAPGWSGSIELATNGYSAQLESLEIVPPLRVGVVEVLTPLRIAPDSAWNAEAGEAPAPGALNAASSASKLSTPIIALPQGGARVRAKLTLFKALDNAMWIEVSKSYRNRLELERWPAAQRRSRVGGCLEGGTHFDD